MCVVKKKKLRRERKKRRVAGERRIDKDREREGESLAPATGTKDANAKSS